MIKLIVGNKGSGKTKAMVDAANAAAKTSKGNVVCIERGLKLTYDLDHAVRLIDAEEYKVDSYETLYGFLSGVMAGNYDITDIFVDGTLKIGGKDFAGLSAMVQKLDAQPNSKDTKITFSISADASELPAELSKYF